MSVIERIRQIQEEEARKAAEAEAARVAEEKRTEPERLAAAEAERQEELIKMRQQEENIKETGIAEKLQQIEREFLQHTTHHLFITRRERHYYNNDDIVDYELDWDYKKDQKCENHVEGYNYKSICVSLDLTSGRLGINGGRSLTDWIDKGQWVTNKQVIDDALAAAYLSPNFNREPGPDTSWSIN